MLKTLSIRNFRCFDQFEMHDLGRVNLLVGTNNSGKTSVLEAIELLCARTARTIWAAGSRRGETLPNAKAISPQDKAISPQDVAVRHLFRGHSLIAGNEFLIEATDNGHVESVMGRIDKSASATTTETTTTQPSRGSTGGEEEIPASESDARNGSEFEPVETSEQPLDLNLNWKPGKHIPVHLTEQGGIEWRSARRGEEHAPPVRLITTGSLPPFEAVSLWDMIVLTEEEQLVIGALRTIDPTIKRIAAVGAARSQTLGADEHGGFRVLLEGTRRPIPIGSMGDGIWRMLGLAMALVQAKEGVLLVDEIDTGLHYTVMVDMWKMVAETAKRLNVQVFATTHSRDCYESLAAIAHEYIAEGSEVTIQRIEREKGRAIAYTEQEIVAAAEYGGEVR